MSEVTVNDEHKDMARLITVMGNCNLVWDLFNEIDRTEPVACVIMLDKFRSYITQLLNAEGLSVKKENLGVLVEIRGAIITMEDMLLKFNSNYDLNYDELKEIVDEYRNKGIPMVKITWVLGIGKMKMSAAKIGDFMRNLGMI
jgi:hypothetical protein